ncbi:MAG: YybH family protein [Ginsengibacter sp.]
MLLNRKTLFLFIFLPFVLISCNEQDKLQIEKSASAFDIKQGEASVFQCNQRFMKAYNAGDSVEVSKCFTTDAKAMAPNQATVKGRENIIHFISTMMKSGVSDFDLKTIKIWGDSSILAEEGSYELSDSGGKQIDKGNYIALWKQEAGNWKMYRHIWTSNLPSSAINVKQMNLPKH